MKKTIELNLRECMACMIMGKLKYNKEDRFYKCWRNDIIMTVAKLLLRRDPVKFVVDLLELNEGDVCNSGLTNL